MSRIEAISELVSPLPSRRFAKLASCASRLHAMDALEKTASVSEKIAAEEKELLEAFYKEAFLGGAMAMGRGAFNAVRSAGKAGANALKHSPRGQKLTEARKAVGNNWRGAFHQTPGAAQAASSTAAHMKKFQVPYSLAAGAAAGYGGSKVASDLSAEEQVAAGFFTAGRDLLKTANLRADEESHRETLTKLASVGVVNYRLQEAVSSGRLSEEGTSQVYKLAQENNAHCISLLKSLVPSPEDFRKEANSLLGYGPKTTMPVNKGVASGIKNAFGGKSASNEGMFGSIGSAISGAFGGGGKSEGLGAQIGKSLSGFASKGGKAGG